MNTPDHLRYEKTDEWVKLDGDTAVIGISDYAQDQLSDVVFAEIQVSVGDLLPASKVIATVESVKATSDVHTPLSGKVIAINEEIATSPEILNADPYNSGWLIKIQVVKPDEWDHLMSAAAYQKFRTK